MQETEANTKSRRHRTERGDLLRRRVSGTQQTYSTHSGRRANAFRPAFRPVVLVDGTDVPTRNRAEAGLSNYSGKRHRQGLNVQIAADLDGRLLAASDPIAG
ncbi:transposase, partial [Rathayibacter rathayi]|uniref:transposase n=1 Tax=Rathayibacter rathayi TaxID=33887 RepID=UPI0011B0F245